MISKRSLTEAELVKATEVLKRYLLPVGISKNLAFSLITDELFLPNSHDFGGDWQRIVSRVRVRAVHNVALENGSIDTVYYPKSTVMPLATPPGVEVLISMEQIIAMQIERLKSLELPPINKEDLETLPPMRTSVHPSLAKVNLSEDEDAGPSDKKEGKGKKKKKNKKGKNKGKNKGKDKKSKKGKKKDKKK